METETTALTSKKKQNILVRKSEQTQTFNFVLIVYWVASRLRLTLERIPTKNGDRKLSPPHIFATRVQLHVFTLSRFAFNCQKYDSSPHHHLVSAVGISASARSAHAYTIFRNLFFKKLQRVLWPGYSETVWIIYLFIQFQFSMCHSITLH